MSANWFGVEFWRIAGFCPVVDGWLELECFLEPCCRRGLVSLGALAAFASAFGAVGRGFIGDLGEMDPRGLTEDSLGST